MSTDSRQVTDSDIEAISVAPRVTRDQVNEFIKEEFYFTAKDGVLEATRNEDHTGNTSDLTPLSLMTFCVLVLQNGFTVHGYSACASPENYNQEIGQRLAREKAVDQIWGYLAFELRTKLSQN